MGAIAASVVVLIAFNDDAVAATTHSGDNDQIVVETMISALFVAVILQSNESRRWTRTRPHRRSTHAPRDPRRDHPDQRLVGGPGAEPRPAIVGTDFGDLWILLILPFVGGFLGWVAHKVVVEGDTRASAAAAARAP